MLIVPIAVFVDITILRLPVVTFATMAVLVAPVSASGLAANALLAGLTPALVHNRGYSIQNSYHEAVSKAFEWLLGGCGQSVAPSGQFARDTMAPYGLSLELFAGRPNTIAIATLGLIGWTLTFVAVAFAPRALRRFVKRGPSRNVEHGTAT